MDDEEKSQRKTDSPEDEVYILRLYVAGQTAKSLTAFANLKKMTSTWQENTRSRS